jgi:hypothetical protein
LLPGIVPAIAVAALAGGLWIYDTIQTAESIEETIDQQTEKLQESQENLDKIRELLEKNRDREQLPICR